VLGPQGVAAGTAATTVAKGNIDNLSKKTKITGSF